MYLANIVSGIDYLDMDKLLTVKAPGVIAAALRATPVDDVRKISIMLRTHVHKYSVRLILVS